MEYYHFLYVSSLELPQFDKKKNVTSMQHSLYIFTQLEHSQNGIEILAFSMRTKWPANALIIFKARNDNNLMSNPYPYMPISPCIFAHLKNYITSVLGHSYQNFSCPVA